MKETLPSWHDCDRNTVTIKPGGTKVFADRMTAEWLAWTAALSVPHAGSADLRGHYLAMRRVSVSARRQAHRALPGFQQG